MTNTLEIKNLTVILEGRDKAPLKIIDRLNLSLAPGEILGLVGESGSGKSMTALSVMGLLPPGVRISQGEIFFKGRNLTALTPEKLRSLRGLDIGMVFQEPMTALNPVFTVGRQVAEVYTAHLGLSKKQAWQEAVTMLGKAGMPDPARRAGHYPHQLSGGMRQRVLIAMAMALNPALLLADEPTTALDVTIQAQILALLGQLVQEEKSACLLITHNLAVVAQMAQRVAVMYAGRLVEVAAIEQMFSAPLHPYTQGLWACLPAQARAGEKLPVIAGTVPSLGEVPPAACSFAPRCPQALDLCRQAEPALLNLNGDRRVACFLRHQERK
ncbi:MAG: ABC transporter ATP-binding protein [Desulfarculales bacterium]|jgi:oligopeptide/dipeptide ABC transporter ATP-binding protein|nr:ABC transporter ATP-binding protein [Desulfarculales bacterium]